ncbi:MAG TPA: class I SAM-dependent methyltransferase, partial [Acidimicrobiia bacterium]|nr:class I SAM-dependent methyltransferase [Acidimicrobiia bacterium]
MERGEASRTAMMAATVRGLHRRETAPPWLFDDHLALDLVGPAWPDLQAQMVEAVSQPLLHRLGVMTATRARYSEERLAAGPFEQYVLLGAGLDSFAWRHPDRLVAG